MFQTTVQSTHLDMFGHVNNARFLEYFEWARWDWARRADVDLMGYIARGLSPAAVWMGITYERELRMGDEILVATRVGAIGHKSFTLHQELRGADGLRSACLEAKLVFVSGETRRAVPLPVEFREVLEGLGEENL